MLGKVTYFFSITTTKWAPTSKMLVTAVQSLFYMLTKNTRWALNKEMWRLGILQGFGCGMLICALLSCQRFRHTLFIGLTYLYEFFYSWEKLSFGNESSLDFFLLWRKEETYLFSRTASMLTIRVSFSSCWVYYYSVHYYFPTWMIANRVRF